MGADIPVLTCAERRAKVELEIAETTPCFHCREPMLLTESECSACQKEVPPRLTILDFLGDFFSGHIIDARAGGLVVGRHDNEEDIPMILGVATGVLQISGMMQGGEYVVNKEATAKHATRIEEINSYKTKSRIKQWSALSFQGTSDQRSLRKISKSC